MSRRLLHWGTHFFKSLKRPEAITCVAVLVLMIAAIWLWHFHGLRVYIAGLGTAVATFLGAFLPSVIEPKTRGKWLIAVGVAAFVGVVAGFGADQAEKERKHAEKEASLLNERVSLQQQFFRASVKSLSEDEKRKFLLGASRQLAKLYPHATAEPILDVVAVVNEIDSENGHALYFAGEEFRSLFDQTDMRGVFQRYLASVPRHPLALDGIAHDCHDRVDGYCGERTALINHMMARDAYDEALKYDGERRATGLRTALDYEQKVLDIWHVDEHGSTKYWHFNRDGTFASSCEILLGIAMQFRATGQPTKDADEALQKYHSRIGGC